MLNVSKQVRFNVSHPETGDGRRDNVFVPASGCF